MDGDRLNHFTHWCDISARDACLSRDVFEGWQMMWEIECGTLAIYVYVLSDSPTSDTCLYEFQCCTYDEDGWVEYNPNQIGPEREPIAQFDGRAAVIKAITARAENCDIQLSYI